MNVGTVLANRAVRTVYQPIVDLEDGAVIAYEALTRGPAGSLERPDVLFAAARREGLLEPLDLLCRATALRTAASMDWPTGLALFVNVEPQVLEAESLDELIELGRSVPQGLQVVLEITERAISVRPAELLASVRKLRRAGWSIALDDVGADDMSLAFMSLIRPDVVKLDLKLVQERPSQAAARISSAVNAFAEQTGAVLLAEGIEDEAHLQTARALGARLGQGWLFGRPSPVLPDVPSRSLGSTFWNQSEVESARDSPFDCLPVDARLRTSTKPLLIEFSKQLELEAMGHGTTCVVLSTFQHAHHFTSRTAERYQRLAQAVGFVAAIGDGLPPEPAPSVRGADLAEGDVLCDEWDVVVLAPHFAAALLARDLGDPGPDAERRFQFALTYDRGVVVSAAGALLARITPVEQRKDEAAQVENQAIGTV